MTDRQFHPETLAIHAGQIPDAATGARALPIYQTSSFVFDSAEHAASLFNLQTFGNVYSRLSNPTVAVLEERVAALEGGRAAVASASGMAAETMALMTILQAGDHVVAAGALYGGSVTMLAVSLAKFGIETTFVDATKPEAFAAAMRPNTRAVYAESLGNPSMVVLDIAAVAEVAVVGAPHERWGETVKAVVVLRQGAQASAQDIIDFCKDRLADFKKPRSVDFVTELPKNSNGKLSRKDVRERYWQGRERKVN